MIDLTQLEASLSARMDAYRLAHTLAVKQECADLAALFGLSEEETSDLLAAALLHDCTKMLKAPAQLALAAELGISLSDDDLKSSKVLHSITGAKVAQIEYGASDRIADMIACHTTGKENMTLSEKLLYLADYIEPTRTFEDCVRLREFFYGERTCDLLAHLDQTLILSFDMTIRNLLADGCHIHLETIKSRNFLLRNA